MTPFVEGVFRKVGPPIAVIACAAMSAWLFVRYLFAEKFANDFGVYWRVARQPLEQVYSWAGNYPFPYAPTMLLWIQPLTLIPKWPAYFLFITVSIVAFVLACRPYIPKRAVALILVTRPFMRGIFTGQVCALLSAMLLWSCGTRNRVLAGIALGVIASVKPHFVIMAPLMLALKRDWRAFVSAGITFLFVVLLSLVLFGPERWPEWVGSMGHFNQALVNINAFSIGVTPAMWAKFMGFNPLPFMLAGTLAGAGLVYLCRSKGPLEQCTAIAGGSLLAAPYALDYDLVALFPFLALMVFRGRIWAVLGVVGALHPIPLAVTAYELLRERLGWYQRNRDDLPASPNTEGVRSGANG